MSEPAAAATEPSTAGNESEPEPDADVGDETEDGADAAAAAAAGSAGTSDLAQIGEQLDFYFGDMNYRCVITSLPTPVPGGTRPPWGCGAAPFTCRGAAQHRRPGVAQEREPVLDFRRLCGRIARFRGCY